MSKRQDETMQYRRLFGRLFIGIGCTIILLTVIVNIIDYRKGRSAVEEFEVAKLQQEQTPESPDADKEVTEKNDKLTKGVIGVLAIDKIEMEEAVKEGAESSVISSALGHISGTAMPGMQGNCAIEGHRNYVFGRFFNRLDEVAVGDVITIETLDNTYEYKVYEVLVVEPTEVSVLEDTEAYDLTLVTCTPLFIGSHRLIIKATLQ